MSAAIPVPRFTPAPSDQVSGPVAPVVCWALYLLAFSIPLEAPDRLPFEVTAMTGALFVFSTIFAPQACYGRLPWAVGWFGVFLLVTLLAFVTEGAAYPGGLYLRQVEIQTARLGFWLLLFWTCSNLLRNERIYRAALWSLIAGCLVRAALPVLGLARSATFKGTERVAALGQNPNQSALVLAMGLLALIGLTYIQPTATRRLRVLAWGGSALIAVGIVQTGSRGGLATAVIGALIFLGRGRTLRMRIRNLTVGLILLGGLSYLAIHLDTMSARLEKAVATGNLSDREVIWPLAVGMVRDKPLLGWGPVVNKHELAARLKDPDFESRDTHNVLLEVLTATGLLGAIPFLLGLWLCLGAAWSARTGPRGAVPLAMVVAMLAGNMSQNRLTWSVLWLVLAIGLASAGPHLTVVTQAIRRARNTSPQALPSSAPAST
jgi:O-antigen ligase